MKTFSCIIEKNCIIRVILILQLLDLTRSHIIISSLFVAVNSTLLGRALFLQLYAVLGGLIFTSTRQTAQSNELKICVAAIIIVDGTCSSTKESEYKPLSYDAKANYV